MATSDEFFVGQTVTFYPRITGGYVVATVEAIHEIPLYGTSLDILVTDGTRAWPTGLREAISADVVL